MKNVLKTVSGTKTNGLSLKYDDNIKGWLINLPRSNLFLVLTLCTVAIRSFTRKFIKKFTHMEELRSLISYTVLYISRFGTNHDSNNFLL
jgi:hypothetical protein